MKTRGAFTLIEIMVALVLTSVVALLAYGTAHAGIDTRERIEMYRTNVEARMIVRDLLFNALRHPVDGGGAAMNDTLFTIDDRVTSDGLPVNSVRFYSRGLVAPLGATSTWSVTITPTPAGVSVVAQPVVPGSARGISAVLSDVVGVRARVLGRTADTEWQNRWDVVGRVPAAVSLEFLTVRGALAAAPLVVHAALEDVR